ncbi:MAG: hypothetical protein H7Y22_05550 [Gemmatimonadaceae bacterium]|nr:hypothetical protein [Gloeobacterales cyanobacterium ES-bin-141]
MPPEEQIADALEVLRRIPPGDQRVLDACRKLGEVTNQLQSAMASQTDLDQACALVEARTEVTARQAASFLIEILRLAHNL